MTALLDALAIPTPKPRSAEREPQQEALPRFRQPAQWVRYTSGPYNANACVWLLLPKTAWMLKQEAR